jgi:hypothetical protein
MQHKPLSYCIACIWLINGFFCKVLNLTPRHEQIVARILGADYARPLTIIIGLLEVGMGAWIISGKWRRLNFTLQILIVAFMNILEYVLASDLLLWGKLNALFAFIFICFLYYIEFHINRKSATNI